jgi:hypothetical protein
MVLYVYMCCVCVFSLHRESLNMMLGDKPLIYDVVLSRSPLVDVAMSSRCVVLPFHGAKLSSLHLLHLLTRHHLIAPPPLEPKPKHWICTTTVDHPSLDSLTPTLRCYKKVILTLATLLTTQLHLQFASSLTRAPCHRSSNGRRHSLSPPTHAHRPSKQQHLRWRTRRPSFTYWTPRWGLHHLSCPCSHLW